jgi:hypothetical protein
MGRAALISLAGAACGALALVAAGTPIAGLPWTVAVVLACVGYGEAAVRSTGARLSLGLTAVIGLAIMLVVATALARIGVLTRAGEIVLVALGLVAAVAARPQPRRLEVVAIVVGLACVALTLTQQVSIVDDGANHALLVKKLWDTGRLGAINHQGGAQIAGEALLSLASNANALTIFDEGLCTALLLLLLASELADRGELGVTLFVLLAVPIALHPMPERGDLGLWAAVLLHVATFRLLEDALQTRRTGWIVIPLALALALLRHEYGVLAVPYLVAAVVVPTRALSRRTQLAALGLWAVGLFAMQLAYRSTWPLAVGRLLALAAVVPLTAVVHRIARVPALTVLAFATLSMIAAIASGATSPSFHADIATTATLLGAAICLVMAVDREPVRVALAAIGIVFVVGTTIVDANIPDLTRERIRTRWVDAAGMLDELRMIGYRVEADHEIAALQARVPSHARLAFWGQSAGAFDFARNPLRDVSWQLGHWRTSDYLDEIDPRALRHIDFLIVQHVPGRARRDAWGSRYADPFAEVRAMVEPVAATPRAQLFRVRH